MGTENINYNEHCLFFASNSLTRAINEITERAFETIGISASYGHLMLVIIDEPNLTLGEISKRMNVKSSTMTRLIDKLQQKGYVERHTSGRSVSITPTQKGKDLRPKIMDALKVLFNEYCDKLGKDFAVKLTEDIHKANTNLYQ